MVLRGTLTGTSYTAFFFFVKESRNSSTIEEHGDQAFLSTSARMQALIIVFKKSITLIGSITEIVETSRKGTYHVTLRCKFAGLCIGVHHHGLSVRYRCILNYVYASNVILTGTANRVCAHTALS